MDGDRNEHDEESRCARHLKRKVPIKKEDRPTAAGVDSHFASLSAGVPEKRQDACRFVMDGSVRTGHVCKRNGVLVQFQQSTSGNSIFLYTPHLAGVRR